MKHVDIKKILELSKDYLDKEVAVCGWIKTSRNSKNITFVELNDGSCLKNLQVVVDINNNSFELLTSKPVGTSVKVVGKVVNSANENQKVELLVSSVVVLGECPSEYPLQKKRHTLEYLRDIPHLRLRTNTFNAMIRLRSEVSFAIHKFYQERGFYYVHTPIITGSDCEGAGEVFKVTTLDIDTLAKNNPKPDYEKDDFFGRTVGLTVSGQLEGEALATAMGRIYTFGPTFRAENSNTTRHAAEFWQIEPEVSFAELDDIIELASDMIKYLLKHIITHCKEEIDFFMQHYDSTLMDKFNNVINSEFARVEYTDAIEILKNSKEKFEYPVYWGCDLKTEHERYITEKVYNKPVFMVNYPKELKSFYMKLNPDGKTVAATDLLVPGVGEIIGASQREDNFDILEQKIKDLKMNMEDYWWYLELRKYGSVPHSGFGLGLERFMMYITSIGNIRDTIPFPRTKGPFKI